MNEKLLTVDDAAERLNCSPSFVYGLMSSGRLKHYGLGKNQGGKRISEAQLQAYLQGVERGGQEEITPIPEQFAFLRPS